MQQSDIKYCPLQERLGATNHKSEQVSETRDQVARRQSRVKNSCKNHIVEGKVVGVSIQ